MFVPVIVDRRHGRLRFYPLGRKTRRGVFGIAVPVDLDHPLLPRWLNLIVVPLVGVDAEGRRLGMGGGFYDPGHWSFCRTSGAAGQVRTWPGLLLIVSERTPSSPNTGT